MTSHPRISIPALADATDIEEAFREVLGYRRAYLVWGGEGAADYGWALRNFNEVCAQARFDDARTTP